MALPLWPTDVIRFATKAAADLASVPGRVLDLLSAAEDVVGRADELVRRTERVIDDATDSVEHARRVTTEAEEQVAAARPILDFLREFSAHEIQAAIRLVDELPRLATHLADDIMPILATLDRVGPDIHELLAVGKDVRQAILGIPGFEYLRRRGEGKDDAKDESDSESS
jgi:hypothetical protein